MNTLAIALVLLSAAIHALRDLFTKRSSDRQIFIFLFVWLSTILFLPFFLWYMRSHAFPWEWLGLMMLASAFHTSYGFGIARSYDHGDLSHVYPIIRSSPAFILLFSFFFLGETATPLGIIGILLIIAGAYLINARGWSLDRILEPLRSIRSEKATQWAFLTMCIVCVYSLMDRTIVTQVDPWIYLYVMTAFLAIYMTPFILLFKPWRKIVTVAKVDTVGIIANSFIAFTSYGCVLFALQLAKVSYVSGLRQISVLFAVYLGGHILKEQSRWERMVAAALIFLGAICISFAE